MEPMKFDAGNDRRKHRRIDRHDPVRLSEVNLFDELAMSEINERQVDGRLMNISAGGLQVETDLPFELESLLKIQICIPDWVKYDHTRLDTSTSKYPCEPLVAVGKVIRKELSAKAKWNLGVSFVAIDEKHRKAVSRLVSSKLRT